MSQPSDRRETFGSRAFSWARSSRLGGRRCWLGGRGHRGRGARTFWDIRLAPFAFLLVLNPASAVFGDTQNIDSAANLRIGSYLVANHKADYLDRRKQFRQVKAVELTLSHFPYKRNGVVLLSAI